MNYQPLKYIYKASGDATANTLLLLHGTGGDEKDLLPIALGYSNGANIAGSTLLLYPDLLAGAILYRPMQPFKIIGAGVKTSKQVPVFMSNGAMDPTIDPAATRNYVEILKNAGFDVTHHALPAGHNLTQQDLQLSVDWYTKLFEKV